MAEVRDIWVQPHDCKEIRQLAERRDRLRSHRNTVIGIGIGCIVGGALIQALTPPGIHGILGGLMLWVVAIALHLVQHLVHRRLRALMAKVEGEQ